MVSNENEFGDILESYHDDDWNVQDIVIDDTNNDKNVWVVSSDIISKLQLDTLELDVEETYNLDDWFRSVAFDDDYLYLGSSDGYLRKISKDSLEIEWTEQEHENEELIPFVEVDDERIYTGSTDESVIAYDKEGNFEWEHTHHSDTVEDGVIDNGDLYTCDNNGNVVKVDAETGESEWNENAGDRTESIEIDQIRVYVYDMGDNHVIALDKEDGSEEWESEESYTRGENMVADDAYVYILREPFSGGTDYAQIDKTNGETTNEIDLDPADGLDNGDTDGSYSVVSEEDDNEDIWLILNENRSAVRVKDTTVDGVDVDIDAVVDYIDEDEDLDLEGVECLTRYRLKEGGEWSDARTITETSSAPFDFQDTVEQLEEFENYLFQAGLREKEEFEEE